MRPWASLSTLRSAAGAGVEAGRARDELKAGGQGHREVAALSSLAVRGPGELPEGEGTWQPLLHLGSGAPPDRSRRHDRATYDLRNLKADGRGSGAIVLPNRNLLSACGTDLTGIKRGLGEEATDGMVAQVITITGGIHRHVDMIIPRILASLT